LTSHGSVANVSDDDDPATQEPSDEDEPQAQTPPTRKDSPKDTRALGWLQLSGMNALSKAVQDSIATPNAIVADAIARNVLSPGLSETIAKIQAQALPSATLSAMNASVQAAQKNILSGLWTSPAYRTFFDQLSRSAALTRPSDYLEPDPPAATYSEELSSPGDYFAARELEVVVDSFHELTMRVEALIGKNPGLPLVWRGMRSAEWGVHSALFRQLLDENGVKLPRHGERIRGEQRFPDEDQMVKAETEILRLARQEWRMDGIGALEIFARIQHAGGPTRLLDVTKNPFIGAWFAVEAHPKTDEEDARLLAFATRPVRRDGSIVESQVELDGGWAGRDPLWHALEDAEARQHLDWGTGARRWVWFPPLYDQRIAAQNAGFILDGVPMTSKKTAKSFPSSDNGTHWTRADLLASVSVYARIEKPTRQVRPNAGGFAATFSFRITARAKAEIRDMLESRFGYTRASIYPDTSGLAEHLKTVKFGA
jgi:hypothetical protein